MMPPSTAAQKIALIPEILGLIFEETDDQARIARVCKFWCQIVVGFIWRRIPQVEVLFRLLAPLTMKDGKVAFTRALTTQDWTRFDYYACRVHELCFRNFFNSSPALHPSLMMEISTTRGPSELLPNLRCLRLNPSTFDRADIFLHSTITSLHIIWLQTDCHLVGSLIASLPTQTPSLEELFLDDDGFYSPGANEVGSHPPDADVERILAKALQKLSSLTLLDLPTWWPTSAIFHAAAACPRLSQLRIRQVHPNSGEIDGSKFERLCSTSLPPGGFPSLCNLETSIPFFHARNVLSQHACFNVLSRLNIESPRIEVPQEYGALLASLSNCCTNLEDLCLDVVRLPRPITDQYDSVTFNELSSIIKLTSLEDLYLRHTMPFQIVTEEVVTIVRALPNLTYMSLNPSPDIESATTLDVSVLSPLCNLRPNLALLRLYLDTSEEHIPPPPSSDDEHGRATLDSAAFSTLMELDVSTSYLSSPIPLAIYLSRVLPSSCSLEFGERGDDDDGRIFENWGEVKQLIPAFRQVRDEGIRVGRASR